MSTEETPSVLDHEAFATKNMPDLGHDVKEFQIFHWKLSGWKRLERKLTSSEFDCGGHKWRIRFFPRGNFDPPQDDTISVYLDRTGPKEKDWHACTQFALAISNPHDPTIYTVSHTHHRFTAKEHDWGFTRFSDLRELFQPQPGDNRPTIEEDSTVVSVYLRVLEDFVTVNHDSKKQTGYVGLKNQGTTAFMNAELQSLFHIHCFRKAVYQIPTENQHPTESVLLALQRVFYDLQTSDQPVDASVLAKSFGWNSTDLLMARDEFNRALQRKLEPLIKGTPAEGEISKLFRGKVKSFVRCVNVNYEEYKIEEFDDIRLEVKGIKTLYDSFRDYIAIETLDGENKYDVKGFGLQDARKGTIFQSFPSVLHLQLKRFVDDAQLNGTVKINDCFEFPSEIDLDEFLDKAADRSKHWKYKLHSVLVHSGDPHHGHNYALVRPDRSAQWFKFDDGRVTPVTDREVLEENYGGGPGVSHEAEPRASTNAYKLAYIRQEAINEVMAPLTKEDTPLRLKRKFDEYAQADAGRDEQGLFLTAKVVTDETFSRHEGFDLATFDGSKFPPTDLPTFHVLKREVYSVFKSRVAQHFGYPESQIWLWVMANRKNGTVRVDTHIPESEPSLTIEEIYDHIIGKPGDLRLYLDILPDPFVKIRWDSAGMIIIFLKHFDIMKQSLFGIGKIHIPEDEKVSDLIPIINERMGWAPGTPLELYEEIKPGMIERTKLGSTFAESELQDGDIICFQVDISDRGAQKFKSQGLSSNPHQFYKVLQNRVAK